VSDELAPCRLDVALVRAGLVTTRARAQRAIADGRVMVDGKAGLRASQIIAPGMRIEVTDDPWVSRAAHKLLGALDDTGLTVPPRCLDAGASTGGFTQVLLSRGAQVVYAVDVGHGQLASQIAADPRVVAREGLNVKDMTLADVGGQPVDLLVADLSFISLPLVLPALLPLVIGDALVLVKPQFEAGRELVGSGVVRDEAVRQQAVAGVCEAAMRLGWQAVWQGESRLPGAQGNVEYFVHLWPL